MSLSRSAVPWLLIGVAWACSQEAAHVIPPQHVLLVTVSSLRADHLSCYQYRRPTSAWEVDPGRRPPGDGMAIDDLAAEGVLFTGFQAPATAREGVEQLFRASGAECMGRLLQEGFEAAAFGSFCGELPPEDVQAWFSPFHSAGSDDEARGAAIEWLRARDPDAPLFLWLHWCGPRPPYEPRPLAPRPGGDPGEVDYASLYADPFQRTTAIDLYDGEVARVASLARVFFAYYRELGARNDLWEDTLIVFAGLGGETPEATEGAGPSAHSEKDAPLFFLHRRSIAGQRVLHLQAGSSTGPGAVMPAVLSQLGLDEKRSENELCRRIGEAAPPSARRERGP